MLSKLQAAKYLSGDLNSVGIEIRETYEYWKQQYHPSKCIGKFGLMTLRL